MNAFKTTIRIPGGLLRILSTPRPPRLIAERDHNYLTKPRLPGRPACWNLSPPLWNLSRLAARDDAPVEYLETAHNSAKPRRSLKLLSASVRLSIPSPSPHHLTSPKHYGMVGEGRPYSHLQALSNEPGKRSRYEFTRLSTCVH